MDRPMLDRRRLVPPSLLRLAPSLFWTVAVALIVAYGAYLRLDSLVGTYGPFTHPGWLVRVQDTIAATREAVVPQGWFWTRDDTPYTGDPVNYIIFAREMTSFYQAHVREPVFLAATRGFLAITDGQDVAVSLASASFSTLAILATFLLGSAAVSRWVGLAAAWLTAVEGELVAWAPDGWRDDAFTAMVALSGWAALRLAARPRWPEIAGFGVVAAAACLTRITALSFLLPVLVLMALLRGDRPWRQHLARIGAAAAIMTLLVAPYLINCYRATGDPFFAINEHTRFYRAAAGESHEEPMSALSFAISRVRDAPVAGFDTALRGLFVYPMALKFRAFTFWPPGAALVLKALTLVGLFLWLWQPRGWLLLVVLFSSLAPYMLTWSLPGGGEWRFTMHAYPFYLVAAAGAVWAVGAFAVAAWRRGGRVLVFDPAERRQTAIRLGAGAAIAAFALGWAYEGPALVLTESLETGESVSVHTGPSDGVFYRAGWSDTSQTGVVVSRFATTLEAVAYVPLPERRPYRLVFRIDPMPRPAEDPPQHVEVRLEDDVTLGAFDLALDPDRVGSYPVQVPAELAGRGLTKLTFISRDLRRAGEHAVDYSGITADTEVAFRIWYIRVIPE